MPAHQSRSIYWNCNWKFKLVVYGGSFSGVPDRKNYNYQAYSCPRDWRLPAYWASNYGTPGTSQTSQHYGIKGVKGALNWAPIILITAYEFFPVWPALQFSFALISLDIKFVF